MERAQVEALLERIFAVMDPDVEYELRHPDFEALMPQSGERFPTRDALREMQRAFGAPPVITLRRLVGEGDTWVAEADADYGGEPWLSVLVIEFRDGLILRETRYYTEPLEAPEWRAGFVARMDA
jgi:ketosteroid isomerase-like protein